MGTLASHKYASESQGPTKRAGLLVPVHLVFTRQCVTLDQVPGFGEVLVKPDIFLQNEIEKGHKAIRHVMQIQLRNDNALLMPAEVPGF